MLCRFLAFTASLMMLLQVPTVAAETTNIIVPSTAGGTQDRIARLLAQKLGTKPGASYIVVNKPGAGGIIGSQEVARAAPNGRTLGVVYDSHATNHLVFDVPYDTFKAFDYVSLLVSAPHVLVTSTELPYKTLDDLLTAARTSPEKISYGAIGASSTTVSAVTLAQKAGVKVVPVNYSGGGGAYATDLIAGRFDYAMASLPIAMTYIKAGKLRALAYGGTTRSSLLPDIPTLGEKLPGMTASSWVGLIAPAGLPKPKLAELNEIFNNVLKSDDLRQSLESEGFVIEVSTPDQFAARVRKDAEELSQLISTLPLKK